MHRCERDSVVSHPMRLKRGVNYERQDRGNRLLRGVGRLVLASPLRPANSPGITGCRGLCSTRITWVGTNGGRNRGVCHLRGGDHSSEAEVRHPLDAG